MPLRFSMASTGRPNSGGIQFSINTVHNAFLDWFAPGQSRHPVFRNVIAGQDVVKAIETAPTDCRDRPLTPVQVSKVTMQQG